MFAQHPSVLGIFGLCVLLFPKLALGLSDFEIGVAVMPLIEGKKLKDRIRNTRKLLIFAAVIMSVFLIATSMVTTLLIPAKEFAEGGAPWLTWRTSISATASAHSMTYLPFSFSPSQAPRRWPAC